MKIRYRKLIELALNALVFLFIVTVIGYLMYLAYPQNLPKSSSEIAAWFQAFGAIFAIIGAFYLADRQHAASQKCEHARHFREEITKIKIINAICSNTHTTARLIQKEWETSLQKTPMENQIMFLKNCQMAFNQLQLFDIPASELAIYVLNVPVAIQQLCTSMKMHSVERTPIFGADRQVEAGLSELLQMCTQLMKTCYDEIARRS